MKEEAKAASRVKVGGPVKYQRAHPLALQLVVLVLVLCFLKASSVLQSFIWHETNNEIKEEWRWSKVPIYFFPLNSYVSRGMPN